jgi:hypothetical protein
VALGVVWYFGFRYLYPLKHHGKQLVVERELLISDDNIMEHETILFDWLPGDGMGMATLGEEANIRRHGEPSRMPFYNGPA